MNLRINFTNFLNFLAILFEDGKRVSGSELLQYADFVKNVNANNVQYDKDEVIDFFSLCNYFKITDMEGDKKFLKKNYEEAKLMFQALIYNSRN